MTNEQNQVLRVRAAVHLHATEQGGRSTAIAHRYMPNLKVNGIDGYAGFMLGEGNMMAPGSDRIIELAMVGTSKFIAELRPGQKFTVHEGSNNIGEGLIEMVLAGPMDHLDNV